MVAWKEVRGIESGIFLLCRFLKDGPIWRMVGKDEKTDEHQENSYGGYRA